MRSDDQITANIVNGDEIQIISDEDHDSINRKASKVSKEEYDLNDKLATNLRRHPKDEDIRNHSSYVVVQHTNNMRSIVY